MLPISEIQCKTCAVSFGSSDTSFSDKKPTYSGLLDEKKITTQLNWFRIIEYKEV